MKAKKIIIGNDEQGGTTLYMCPNCKKGHQVEIGIKECDICHVQLEWDKEDARTK